MNQGSREKELPEKFGTQEYQVLLVAEKVNDDCLRELRWLYDRRDLGEARRDLAAWLAKWQATYPKLCGWVEEHIEARRAGARPAKRYSIRTSSRAATPTSWCAATPPPET